ncbi:MAG: hypothetical protein IT433_00555 [Phycisphaerales bacterium]|nr:hypothetical protein [Phycisphaerales bacterium]
MGTLRNATAAKKRSPSAGGGKKRSATRPAPMGSRVEPSHLTEQARTARTKKAANAATRKKV